MARVPTKWKVVVLALGELGATSSVVDTEDVAVQAHSLAPTAFSWRKYPEQIDLDSVRVSLTDACKAKYGALASGSVRTGWNLTPAGVAWLGDDGQLVRKALANTAPAIRADAKQSTFHLNREATRVKTSEAFREWAGGGSPSDRSIANAFRIDAYTSTRDRQLKVNRMLDIAAETADKDLEQFVRQVSATALSVAQGLPQAEGDDP